MLPRHTKQPLNRSPCGAPPTYVKQPCRSRCCPCCPGNTTCCSWWFLPSSQLSPIFWGKNLFLGIWNLSPKVQQKWALKGSLKKARPWQWARQNWLVKWVSGSFPPGRPIFLFSTPKQSKPSGPKGPPCAPQSMLFRFIYEQDLASKHDSQWGV